VVQFSGGEPTIHPQIIDFVKAAKDRGIPFVMINTNGKRSLEASNEKAAFVWDT